MTPSARKLICVLLERTVVGEMLGLLERPLGPALGSALGPELGKELGSALSDVLGPALGEVLGALLGTELVAPLGDELGRLLGEALGIILGDTLGTVQVGRPFCICTELLLCIRRMEVVVTIAAMATTAMVIWAAVDMPVVPVAAVASAPAPVAADVPADADAWTAID
jgi:hypothetical protein